MRTGTVHRCFLLNCNRRTVNVNDDDDDDDDLMMQCTDVPKCRWGLHWLRIPEHIEYKIALLTYKVTHGMAPRYLGPFVRVADLPGRRALRSAVTNRLTVPAV